MRCILNISATAMTLLVSATAVSAVEATFKSPRMHGVPIDLCYRLGDDCGQRPADVFCQSEGFQRAMKFENERRQPTRVIGERAEERKVCNGPQCTALKNVTCFAPGAKPGPAKGFPPIVD